MTNRARELVRRRPRRRRRRRRRRARAPVHPDDRLWRHPSEVAWTDRPDVGAGPRRPTTDPDAWALALTSALTGAALALGIVALVGGLGGTDDARDGRRRPTRSRARPRSDARPSLAAIAERSLPSIVRIEVRPPTGDRDGTGIVVLDDGHVLTNAHVVDGADAIELVIADGTAVPGRRRRARPRHRRRRGRARRRARRRRRVGPGAVAARPTSCDVGQPVVAVGAAADPGAALGERRRRSPPSAAGWPPPTAAPCTG